MLAARRQATEGGDREVDGSSGPDAIALAVNHLPWRGASWALQGNPD